MNEQNNRSVPFAQFLRQRRTALRLRQAEIAAALRVEPETVGHWESGRRRMELDRIPRVAAILHLDTKDLCRRALSEWHPRFHDALFGTGQPQTPPSLEEPRQETGSGRNLLPAGPPEGHPLEAVVIVGNGLSQAEELAQ
jgi:transcriptional regulator with XRE-family HTH domain